MDLLVEFMQTVVASAHGAGLWLGMAFVLGLVHAFDADHVAALSVLATRNDGTSGRKGMGAGLRWSLGHGAVLLVVGSCLFLLGRSMPAEWSAMAERLVGFVMVGLGVGVFIRLVRRHRDERLHLHFHAHDGLRPHAHWHRHRADPADGEASPAGSSHERLASRSHHVPTDPIPPDPIPSGSIPFDSVPSDSIQSDHGPPRHQHSHTPSLVGALHGLAGSAPILALLPAAARSPALGLAYLILFGLGVTLAMMLVSGVFAHLVGRLGGAGRRSAISGIRAVSATGSIAIGVWLGLGG